MSSTASGQPTSFWTSAPSGVSSASTMIPRWSSPRPSSRAEQIIPSDDTSIRFARADGEAAGQHGARESHGHPVADREIRCAADDAAQRARRSLSRTSHETDGLFEFGELLDGHDLADRDRRCAVVEDADLEPEQFDALHVQPGIGQRFRAGMGVRQSGDELA